MHDEPLRPEVLIQRIDEESVVEYTNRLALIVDVYGDNQPILLHIDSLGGDIYSLTLLYEHIRSLPNQIITYTSSKAFSAGAILLSAVASPGMRFASPNAVIMIHEIQADTGHDDIKNITHNVDFLKGLNDKWMNILAKSMKLKSGKDLLKLFNSSHEKYFTAQDALKMGIIDQINYLRISPVKYWKINKK